MGYQSTAPADSVMVQQLRWRDVAQERQAKACFKGKHQKAGGDRKTVL